MQLRDYQADQLDRARAKMREGVRRVLLQLPTGGGKTVMAAEMLGGASTRALTCWFIVHRRELIEQTSRTFTEAGIDHGVIGAGFPESVHKGIQIAGVQTLVNRLDRLPPPQMIVTDEAHHAVAGTWQNILERFPDAWQLGLSATPERLDGRGLKDRFDCIVKGPTTAELIARGFLSPYQYFAPGKPDMIGVRTSHGDFNRGDLSAMMDKPKLIGDVVEHYMRLASGKAGIVFAASREHSRHMEAAFLDAGVRAAHVDGSMGDKERKRLVDAFRAGDLEVLCNVDLFGEGFDVPGIVYVGLARPTKSLALHLQQVGRALRVMEGKQQAIIADHAGNAFLHGLPDDVREWSLEGRVKRAGALGPSDAFSIRQCLDCYRVSPSGTSVCPGCGIVFASAGRKVAQEEGELFQLDRAALAAKAKVDKAALAEVRKAEERECTTIGELTLLAKSRGYSNAAGWAYHKFSSRKSWQNRSAA